MNYKQFKQLIEQSSSIDVDDLSDDELDKMVDDLEWDDIGDLYPSDEDELEDHLTDEEEEEIKLDEDVAQLDEKLSAATRIKKRMSFVRHKARTTMARNIKMRRAAPTDVLMKRARVAARRAMYKKFLRGRNKAALSAGEKDRIEAQVARLKNVQVNLAARMMPKIRTLQAKRLAHLRGAKRKK